MKPGTELKAPIKEENIISKEETMFKIGGDGKAIPETYPIYIYDRDLDKELIDESFLLMGLIKKQKAIASVLNELKNQLKKELDELKEKVKKETDKKIKETLQKEVLNKERLSEIENIKSDINSKTVEIGINESRQMLKDLKTEKEKQTIKKFIELCPCTTSEAYLAFEKGETIEGKETKDWVADLITKKVINPKYTFEEAKRLKPDFKIAIKESIMTVSNYKIKSYRDLMMQMKLEDEKPLTIKKE